MKLTPKQATMAPRALAFIRDDFARQDAAEVRHWGKHLHGGVGVSNVAVSEHLGMGKKDTLSLLDKLVGAGLLAQVSEHTGTTEQRRGWAGGGARNFHKEHWNYIPVTYTVRSYRITPAGEAWLAEQDVARRNSGAPMEVQSILFDRELWTPPRAEAWLRRHDYAGLDLDVKPNTYRYRQHDPDLFRPRSFRTIPFGEDTGIQAVVGKRKHAERTNPAKPFDVGSHEFHVSSSIAENIAETMQHDPYAWYSAIDAVAASEDTARDLWLDRGGSSTAFYKAWPAIRDAAERGLSFPTPPELPSPERVRELRFPKPPWGYREPEAWARNYGFGHFIASSTASAYVLKHPRPGSIEEVEATELDESTLPRSRKIQAMVGWPKIKRPRHRNPASRQELLEHHLHDTAEAAGKGKRAAARYLYEESAQYLPNASARLTEAQERALVSMPERPRVYTELPKRTGLALCRAGLAEAKSFGYATLDQPVGAERFERTQRRVLEFTLTAKGRAYRAALKSRE